MIEETFNFPPSCLGRQIDRKSWFVTPAPYADVRRERNPEFGYSPLQFYGIA
jgi:hypothetical protein